MDNDFLNTWDEKHKRVVVFAGVFDPVHIGHISAATAALRHGRAVVFMPEKIPQHKEPVAAYEQRVEMLKLATKVNEKFEVLNYPENHQYITETFTWLNKQFPDSNFVWMIGPDVINKMPDWRDLDKLKELSVVELLVPYRSGNGGFKAIPSKIAGVKVTPLWRKRNKHSHISSSWIKQNISKRHSALPLSVYQYVKQLKIY